MYEHKIGDQWVEEIDGKMHMVKAVPLPSIYDGKSINGHTCHGCSFVDEWDDDCTLKNPPCRISKHKAGPYIIKDLGILNENGCLRDERTGEFPKLELLATKESTGEQLWKNESVRYIGESFFGGIGVTITAIGNTKQQAIDEWNRRAR